MIVVSLIKKQLLSLLINKILKELKYCYYWKRVKKFALLNKNDRKNFTLLEWDFTLRNLESNFIYKYREQLFFYKWHNNQADKKGDFFPLK